MHRYLIVWEKEQIRISDLESRTQSVPANTDWVLINTNGFSQMFRWLFKPGTEDLLQDGIFVAAHGQSTEHSAVLP